MCIYYIEGQDKKPTTIHVQVYIAKPVPSDVYRAEALLYIRPGETGSKQIGRKSNCKLCETFHGALV